MSIVNCTYGSSNTKVDVTETVINRINIQGYIVVNNAIFGDPDYGVEKKLIVTMSDGSHVAIGENYTFKHEKQQKQEQESEKEQDQIKQQKCIDTKVTIVSCTYGSDSTKMDVTEIVINKLNSQGHINVDNANFGDPHCGVEKKLVVTLSDANYIIVSEGKIFKYDKQLLQVQSQAQSQAQAQAQSQVPVQVKAPLPFTYKIYYHIYANAGNSVIRIFEEQIKTMMTSPIYSSIESINCCLTGNDITNYNTLVNRINQLRVDSGGKFRIRKTVFDDKTSEKYTFYAIRDDVNSMDTSARHNTFICYLHTKGITNDSSQVADWRRCMEYFLVTKAEWTVNRIRNEGADSAGIFLTGKYGIPKHYSGNFWIARTSFLYTLFANFPYIGGDTATKSISFNKSSVSEYYSTEFFLFKVAHRGIDLYPIGNFRIYAHSLPPEKYMF